MENSSGAAGRPMNGASITGTGSGGHRLPRAVRMGAWGCCQVQIPRQVMVQQWLHQSTPFLSTGLYSHLITIPNPPLPQHIVRHRPKKQGLPHQEWKNPAKPPYFRIPVVARAGIPETGKAAQGVGQKSPQKIDSLSWIQPARSLRYRKPIVTPMVQSAIPRPQKAKSAPVETPKTKPETNNPAEERTVEKSPSLLSDVITSKTRTIDRFAAERKKYNKALTAHNRMVAKAIKAFDNGNFDLGSERMIKTNESLGVLNKANKRMMEVQREAFLASVDVDMVHNQNINNSIPSSFLQFQQQVKDIGTLTAGVNYYLQQSLIIPITPDGGFQKTWCRLGKQLIKISKGLE